MTLALERYLAHDHLPISILGYQDVLAALLPAFGLL